MGISVGVSTGISVGVSGVLVGGSVLVGVGGLGVKVRVGINV